MPEQPRRIYSDTEIEDRENYDGFIIRRVVKYTVLVIFIIFLLVLTSGFIWNYFNNPAFQTSINQQILDNLTNIVLAALYILGINYLYKKG